jgi:Family of unknown function (DUF6338)
LDIWTQDKLALFLAFFVPGFISMQVYSLFVATGPRDFTRSLPEAVAYSAIHYAVFGWLLLVTHGVWFFAVAYLVVLVFPVFEPVIVLLIRDWSNHRKKIFSKQIMANLLSPEQDPWDRLFSLDRSARWIRITLKHGAVVGGVLGEGSLTSTFPNPHEVYVIEQWTFTEDGAFMEAVPASGGLIVCADEIKLIELFRGKERQ